MSLKALFRSRRTEPVMEITVHPGGLVSAFIPGDGWAESCEQADREWFAALTPAEQAAHLEWEQAETDQWLAWAKQSSDARR